MATLAQASETAVMHIVIGVAVIACTGNGDFLIHRFLMAFVATDFFVPTRKLEDSLVMVEIPYLPIAGVMAGFARLPQPAFMGILLLVA